MPPPSSKPPAANNTRTEQEGYTGQLHVGPANEHACRHFDGITEYTAVYAGKGCGSKANRE
ncbi:hypothetical protein [Neisseria yangbaofengii]|uniref:hypothetical protein n=1 Tax=Neisseria yangbaofengii TaxID=2709396 RepID=UPI003530FDBB